MCRPWTKSNVRSSFALSRTATVIGDNAFFGDKAFLGDGALLGDGAILTEDGVATTKSLGVGAANSNDET